jgi:hypothetical protein
LYTGEPGEDKLQQGVVGVSGSVGAHMVLVQSGLVLGLPEALDPPAEGLMGE